MKRDYLIVIFFIIINCSCSSLNKLLSEDSFLVHYPKYHSDFLSMPKEKIIGPNKKYKDLILSAIDDFSKNPKFEKCNAFYVSFPVKRIDDKESKIVITIYPCYFFEMGVINNFSYYGVGSYSRIIPNTFTRFGNNIIFWNDQDATHKISLELRELIQKYILQPSNEQEKIYKEYSLEYSLEYATETYWFRKNQTTFYLKSSDIDSLDPF